MPPEHRHDVSSEALLFTDATYVLMLKFISTFIFLLLDFHLYIITNDVNSNREIFLL